MVTTVIKMILIDMMVRILLANVTWKRPWLNKLHKVFPGPPPENRRVTIKDTNIHDKSSTSSPKTSEYHKNLTKPTKELFNVWRLYAKMITMSSQKRWIWLFVKYAKKIVTDWTLSLKRVEIVARFFSAKVYTLYPSVMGGYGQQPEQTGAGKVLLYT